MPITGLTVIQEAIESYTNSEGSCLNQVEGPDSQIITEEVAPGDIQVDLDGINDQPPQMPIR